MITLEQFQKFTGFSDAAIVEGINATLERFDINTPRRIRYFLTHAAMETQGFTKFEENLRYTKPERLVAVWPRRFTCDQNKCTPQIAYAPDYVNNPEELANFVYADRNGNGPSISGDGWKYRGRGGFHLTFFDNYLDYSRFIYGDERCVDDPGLVKLPPDSMMSAGWFWETRKLNKLADADEFTRTTIIVNGSDATVPQRLQVLRKANSIF